MKRKALVASFILIVLLIVPVIPYRPRSYQLRIVIETSLEDFNTNANIPGSGTIQNAMIEPVRTDSVLTEISASLTAPRQYWVDTKSYPTATLGPAQTAVFFLAYHLSPSTLNYSGRTSAISISDLRLHFANTSVVIDNVRAGTYSLNITVFVETSNSLHFIPWISIVTLP